MMSAYTFELFPPLLEALICIYQTLTFAFMTHLPIHHNVRTAETKAFIVNTNLIPRLHVLQNPSIRARWEGLRPVVRAAEAGGKEVAEGECVEGAPLHCKRESSTSGRREHATAYSYEAWDGWFRQSEGLEPHLRYTPLNSSPQKRYFGDAPAGAPTAYRPSGDPCVLPMPLHVTVNHVYFQRRDGYSLMGTTRPRPDQGPEWGAEPQPQPGANVPLQVQVLHGGVLQARRALRARQHLRPIARGEPPHVMPACPPSL
jgi:hypothetical protein